MYNRKIVDAMIVLLLLQGREKYENWSKRNQSNEKYPSFFFFFIEYLDCYFLFLEEKNILSIIETRILSKLSNRRLSNYCGRKLSSTLTNSNHFNYNQTNKGNIVNIYG